MQKRGSNHSGENEDRSEEEYDSLSTMMDRLSIEIKLEKSAEKSNLHRKRETFEKQSKAAETEMNLKQYSIKPFLTK